MARSSARWPVSSARTARDQDPRPRDSPIGEAPSGPARAPERERLSPAHAVFFVSIRIRSRGVPTMMKKAAAIALALGLSTAAFAAPTANQFAASKTALAATKSGTNAKLGSVLNVLYKAQSAPAAAASAQRSLSLAKKAGRLGQLLHATDGYVTVDIALTGDASAERAAFEAYGLTDLSTYDNHLSGRAPIAALATIAGNSSVITVRPALSRLRVGLTNTQGDKAQRTNEVRNNLGLTGEGVKIGVLSDSFN